MVQAPLATGIDMDVRAGQITAILGVNGTGKSTLVKSLLAPASDEWSNGLDTQPPKTIAYLSQLTDFNRRFPMDVQSLVATGAWGQNRAGLAAPDKIQAASERVEMVNYATRPIHELSGGQLQRPGLPARSSKMRPYSF